MNWNIIFMIIGGALLVSTVSFAIQDSVSWLFGLLWNFDFIVSPVTVTLIMGLFLHGLWVYYGDNLAFTF